MQKWGKKCAVLHLNDTMIAPTIHANRKITHSTLYICDGRVVNYVLLEVSDGKVRVFLLFLDMLWKFEHKKCPGFLTHDF